MYVSAISNRFSRGRSTPARRAIGRGLPSCCSEVLAPPAREGPRPPTGGGTVRAGPGGVGTGLFSCRAAGSGARRLALPLLVARGRGADHHDAAVTTDDTALVADRLDARLDLHGSLS